MMWCNFACDCEAFRFRAPNGFDCTARRDVREMDTRARQLGQGAIAYRIDFLRCGRHSAQSEHERPVTFVHHTTSRQ